MNHIQDPAPATAPDRLTYAAPHLVRLDMGATAAGVATGSDSLNFS